VEVVETVTGATEVVGVVEITELVVGVVVEVVTKVVVVGMVVEVVVVVELLQDASNSETTVRKHNPITKILLFILSPF
jgi:hypothetical protein